MRILLAHNSLYYPSHGGGDKSNRLLVEALAERGHDCRVVARLASTTPEHRDQFLEQLAARGVETRSETPDVVVFRRKGVEVHVVTGHANLRGYFSAQIDAFQPHVALTSTDDPAQILLESALRADGPAVVFLARTTLAVPFGPDCAFPSPAKAAVLQRVDGVVGVSRYVAQYLRTWGGLDAVHLPISLFEPGPYRHLGRSDGEFVTLVNPCAVKGISIFLRLAAVMPEVSFGAVPTWGTSRADMSALHGRANISVLDPVDDIDRLLARTRVLLVPSLWAEARSRIVVEAMLRGVPVLAADVGGIPEAMMGVDYLLPVRPIARYHHRVDEQMVPVAEVPEQDVAPWQAALSGLLSDTALYSQLSERSRAKANEYVDGLSVEPFEGFLTEIRRRPRRAASAATSVFAGSALENLSPEKRRLLALRLQKRVSVAQAADSWFPGIDQKPGAHVRLFCFPHAGGGASAFRGWAEAMPAGVRICPVRLPGRESRLGESPFRGMEPMVGALTEAVQPYLDAQFAFFGHSMGAAIAFELARALRRAGSPQPRALFVSGARAPRFRLGHVPPPEPSEEEFLKELDRLEGLPGHVRDSEELLRVVLPALVADTALYRGYTYSEEAPLDLDIRAYGGTEDANIQRAHLEAWAGETTGAFALRLLAGGHFFLESSREEFLAALAADLKVLCA